MYSVFRGPITSPYDLLRRKFFYYHVSQKFKETGDDYDGFYYFTVQGILEDEIEGIFQINVLKIRNSDGLATNFGTFTPSHFGIGDSLYIPDVADRDISMPILDIGDIDGI